MAVTLRPLATFVLREKEALPFRLVVTARCPIRIFPSSLPAGLAKICYPEGLAWLAAQLAPDGGLIVPDVASVVALFGGGFDDLPSCVSHRCIVLSPFAGGIHAATSGSRRFAWADPGVGFSAFRCFTLPRGSESQTFQECVRAEPLSRLRWAQLPGKTPGLRLPQQLIVVLLPLLHLVQGVHPELLSRCCCLECRKYRREHRQGHWAKESLLP